MKKLKEIFLEFGKSISNELGGAVCGTFIAGSVAHQREELLRESSDLDIVVVANNFNFLEILNDFWQEIPTNFRSKYPNMIGLHYNKENVDVGIYGFPLETFLRTCELTKDNILMLRTSLKHKIYTGNDFDGNEYRYEQSVIPYGGSYMIKETPLTLRINGRLVLGSLTNLLLANPKILTDTGVVNEGLNLLWEKHVENFREEVIKGKIKNHSEESFLKVLTKNKTMSLDAKEYILEKAAFYLGK